MQEYLGPVRAICARLPEAYEERAWHGVRWRIRKRTFAHLLPIDAGRPPAYARAAGTDGPAVVLTFSSSGPELAALHHVGPPFFAAPWGSAVVGVVLAPDVDHEELVELLTDSFCLLAPRALAERVRAGSQ
ncbi:hypothetical protein GCM10017691_09280 [Pseudonocardia petroleophila]|uniref:MmcQ/YjbR family DNA-binding protein n=1 Tax=Pseudonocardia petroleophila TaxID=37331 RepID=A0A7G7MJC1_9PSEU|nr:MmcQ/YjbR family DNA-binding protein [Pseudonocardia petroleophila]QNG52882.1 MmcQ/YjbR family DNA-binding protein [Pseudonocardia petroleophila]